MPFDPELDTPLRGVKAIAIAVGLLGEDGEPDLRAMYHGLESGHYDASKRGRMWESTRRRLLGPLGHLDHIKQDTA